MGAAAQLVWISLGYIMGDSHVTKTAAVQIVAGGVQSSKSAPIAPAHNRLLIILSLISLYTLWGGTYLGMRIALEGFPPFFVAGVGRLVGGVVFFFFFRLRPSLRPSPPLPREVALSRRPCL